MAEDDLVVLSTLKTEEIGGLNAYLGVSFSKNTYFSKTRIAQYMRWAAGRVSQFLIIVTDHLEAYDLQVFKNIPFENALQRTLHTGKQLAKAYARAIPPDLIGRVQVKLASDLLQNLACAAVNKRVWDAAAMPKFRHDLRLTVTQSLAGKLDEAGLTGLTTGDPIGILQNYVLEEIAIILYLSGVASPRFEVAIFPYPPQSIIGKIYAGAYGREFADLTGDRPFRFIELAASSLQTGTDQKKP